MIYLLEDDDSIRKLVLYGLDSQGFQAKGFALPSEFWRAMDTELPELVLLDIMLPEEDGLSILKKLRARPATKRLICMAITSLPLIISQPRKAFRLIGCPSLC